jgi:hypothetical protein
MTIFANQSSQLNYWPINGDVKDIVIGNDLDANATQQNTNNSVITYASDRFNRPKGALLIGQKSQFAQTSQPFALPNGSFTITLWTKLTKCSHILSAISPQLLPHQTFQILALPVANSSTKCLSVFKANGSNYATSVDIPVNEWVHVAAVHSAKNNLVLYVNGKTVNETIKPVITFNETNPPASSQHGVLVIGADLNGQNPASGQFDDIKLFSSAFALQVVLQDKGFGTFLQQFLDLETGLNWYWPIVNSTMQDVVSGQDLTPVGSPGFMTDRFGQSNGALLSSSNLSYWQAPPGMYFSGDFTQIGWLYITHVSGQGLPFSN